MDQLHGVMAGIDPAAECGDCGCIAERHTPCCGSCSDCGNVACPEFVKA